MKVKGLVKIFGAGAVMILLWGETLFAAVPPPAGSCPTTLSGNSFSTFACRSSGEYGDRYLSDPKPGTGEPGEAILTSVDFSNSSYTCSVLLGSDSKEKQTISRKSICGEKIENALAGKSWGTFSGNDAALVSGLNRFYGRFKDGSNVTEIGLSSGILQGTAYSDYETFLQNYATNKYFNQTQIASAMSAVDSVTSYRQTLSSILIGVFTGDPDYFETGFIDATGKVKLKGTIALTGASYTAGMPLELKKEIGGMLQVPSAALLAVKGQNPDAERSVWKVAAANAWQASANQLNLFNEHSLGFLLGLNIDMKKVYNKIIMMFFLIGGLFSIGYFAYRKSLEKYGNEPFQMNKLTFLSTAMISMTFFTAPIINDTNITYNAATPHAVEVQGVDNWTTLAQETIRYTLQTSTYFANMASDMVTARFLKYIAEEFGEMVMSPDDAIALQGVAKEIEKKKYQAVQGLAFYENVCRKYYAKAIDDGDLTMRATEADGQMATAAFSSLDSKAVMASSFIRADRLAVEACSKLEDSLTLVAGDIMQSTADLRNTARVLKEVSEKSGPPAESLKTVIKGMLWGQKVNGWINVVSIPPVYFYMKSAGLLMSSKTKIPAILKSPGTDATSALSGKAEGKTKSSGPEFGMIVESVMLSGYWFVLPGFGEVYSTINGMLKGIYVSQADIFKQLSSDGAGTKADTKTLQRILEAFKNKLSNIAKSTPNVSAKIDQLQQVITTKVDEVDKGGEGLDNIIYLIIAAISLYIAIALVTFGIGIFTILVVSAFLAIKIILYFIQVMIFFIAAPIMGVYYTIMGQGSAKNYLAVFSKTLAGMFLTPLIIVLIAALLMPIAEFFNDFFSYTMAIVITAIGQSSSLAGGASITEAASITTIKGISMVFSHLSTMIVSIILIMNAEGWIKKMIGLEGDVDTFKDSSTEVRGGAGGKTLNPVS